tara:strand:+ start:41 stop:286 length:246 start_codon:yes stop_codon:yes gene_type:complete
MIVGTTNMSLEPDNICSICECDFDMESEGGVQGYLGIIPFSLCPMCYSGLMDMYDQLNGDLDDNEIGQEMEDDDEDTHRQG